MNRGSSWLRWDPHIHAPGTVLNDQFREDEWDAYLTKLEQCSPTIEVVGVTDYYITDAYRRAVASKEAGRLENVKLIFPNIEMRLTAAAKSGFVNIHLMVCPDDANHLEELDRLLTHVTFPAHGDIFSATRSDLIRLGKKDHPEHSDAAALRYAAAQFKVDFRALQNVLQSNDWARDNIRVAVAGGTNDGTSGMRQASDAMIRAEIEKFAHVIFASSPGQRDFWLGRKVLNEAQIRVRYGGFKPCMHGSDAHKLDDVGEAQNRYTWIKGGATFDSLRQACTDPANRAFVGPAPPAIAVPSTTIDHVTVRDAAWISTPHVPLNSGLVAVIGARGSGKTALVDLIAHGCDATEAVEPEESRSFRARAGALLGDASVRVQWESGNTAERMLAQNRSEEEVVYQRARYLSQQFVENLCSSNSMSDRLLDELERVVFEAHEADKQEGASTFRELLDVRASRYRRAREREEEAVAEASSQIAIELEKEKLIPQYQAQVAQKKQQIEGYEKHRSRFVPTGSEALVAWHTKLSAAFSKVSTSIRGYTKQRQTFEAMGDEVSDLRNNKAPLALRQMQARHSNSGLSEEMWTAFLLDYSGDVDEALVGYLKWADEAIQQLTGDAPDEKALGEAYVVVDSPLDGVPLSLLNKEKERVEALINADVETQRQYAALTARISSELGVLQTLNDRLKDAEGARKRAESWKTAREEAYQRVFDAVRGEECVLEQLYEPLKGRLAGAKGTLGKLSFSVRRVADVPRWAQEGEDLYIDRRKHGPFRVKGSLIQNADTMLKSAWETGSSKDVAEAMAAFREAHQADLLKEAPVPRNNQADYRSWSKRFAQWLFGSEHIRIEYNVAYDGVDIRKLSPGTRGIVLLLLYLALDEKDDRPLIIDQPEENLDPKSVYEELVPLFIQAKGRRQVIMVTHNANLVVNTDADQIIVADATSHAPGQLPVIRYVSGGLEEQSIRDMVCDILEGGEVAFRERARRLRVSWRNSH